MEPTLVQILVVVANTQVRILRSEVEKGSVTTAFDHGLVGPKGWGNSVSKWAISFAFSSVYVPFWFVFRRFAGDSPAQPKGNLVNIPEPIVDNEW